MIATNQYEFRWKDLNSKKYKKPTSVSAPEYISLLLTWVKNQVADESLFPTDPTIPFPKRFNKLTKVIFKRLFRVFAHMYCQHLDVVQKVGEEKKLNRAFVHFMHFVFEFKLIEIKELKVMKEYVLILLGKEFESKFK